MEPDEIKTVETSEDVVKETVEEKPKRKYTRRAKTESTEEPKVEEPKVEEPVQDQEPKADEVKEEPVVEEAKEEPVEDVKEDVVDEVTEDTSDKKEDETSVIEEVKEEEPTEVVPTPEPPVTQELVQTKDEKPNTAKVDVSVDWDKAVNQFLIFKRQVSIYRAPNSMAKGRPFVGRVQIVANTNDLFVKVRYVRSGLGATYGYAKKAQIIQTGCEVGKEN